MPAIRIHRQVGQVVCQARKAKGLTQGQLAREAHVSRQLINRLEMGDAANISLSRLLQVLAVLGCTLHIEYGDGQEPSQPDSRPDRISPARQPEGMPSYSYELDGTLFEPRHREV